MTSIQVRPGLRSYIIQIGLLFVYLIRNKTLKFKYISQNNASGHNNTAPLTIYPPPATHCRPAVITFGVEVITFNSEVITFDALVITFVPVTIIFDAHAVTFDSLVITFDPLVITFDPLVITFVPQGAASGGSAAANTGERSGAPYLYSILGGVKAAAVPEVYNA
jgi:hypothetical protein